MFSSWSGQMTRNSHSIARNFQRSHGVNWACN